MSHELGGDYRILVGDLLTGGVTDELPPSSFSYSFLRNRPGGFSASFHKPNPRITREILEPPFAIYVERDAVIMWGGIIWSVDPVYDTIRFAGEGFWSHFREVNHPGVWNVAEARYRFKRYTNIDQFEIVRDLIANVQLEPDLNLGVIVDPDTSGVLRSETFFAYEWRNIGQAIEDMAEDSPGFDFSLDVDWEGDALVKRFHFYSSRGQRPDLIFDDHKNATVRSRTIDAKGMKRWVMATGKGTGSKILRDDYEDTAFAGQRPKYMEVIADSEVDNVATLTGRARRQVNSSVNPVQTIALEVTPQPDLTIGAWQVGDWVRVRVDDDYDQVDDTFRITAWEVDVDSDGAEKVSVDFGPLPV